MKKKIRRRNQEKNNAAIRRQLVKRILLWIGVVHAAAIPLSIHGPIPVPAPPLSPLTLTLTTSSPISSIKLKRSTVQIQGDKNPGIEDKYKSMDSLKFGVNLNCSTIGDLRATVILRPDVAHLQDFYEVPPYGNQGRVQLEKIFGTDLRHELEEGVTMILGAVFKNLVIMKNRGNLELGKNNDGKIVEQISPQLPKLPDLTKIKTMVTASPTDHGRDTTENPGDETHILVDLCPGNEAAEPGTKCQHRLRVKKYVGNGNRGTEWQNLPLVYGVMSSICLLSLSASICFFYYRKFQQSGQIEI